ncbi:C2 calcium-dependent domain-containing protein 4C-like [Astyanax mexicanus]|uniref:C2 calcium-dependent domain-containing protein 4C-like n=1 Tax=Astyanax mexicanus TaxID=7994 RepID=UPI000BBD82BA|nr:C2 calcium-dependent domain-containing protein 4C-like [Astyanax mexicanus]
MPGLSICRPAVLVAPCAGSSAAAKREKSLQAPPGLQDAQPVASRHVSLREMVLTPARVPPFTIPPLCAVTRPGRCSAGGGSRRNTLPASAHSLRYNSRCCCPFSALSLTDLEPHSCALSDPGTRAAMSLPHLAKITTPYGFITLGESPCVRRRESLFFQESQTQPGASQQQQQCVKSKSESSLQSCSVAACCISSLQQENYLSTSRDCSKPHKCTHRSSSFSTRKEKLKYFLKNRFKA